MPNNAPEKFQIQSNKFELVPETITNYMDVYNHFEKEIERRCL